MRSLLLSWIRGAEARPRRAVAVSVLCMLVGAGFALTLRPGASVQDMLPRASGSAEAMGRILADFRLIDDVVVLVDPAAGEPDGPAGRLEEQTRALAAAMATRLGDRPDVGPVRPGGSAATPDADAASAAADARRYLARHGGRLLDAGQRETLRRSLEPGALASALGRFRAGLGAAGAEAAGPGRPTADDPLGLLPLLAGELPRAGPADGDADGPDASDGPELPTVRVAATRPANDLAYASALVDAVTQAAQASNPDGLRLSLTGAHAIADFTARSVRRDMIVSLAVTMAALSALFLLIYRSARTLPLLLATVNGGLVVAFGLYAAFGGSLSPVTAVAGAVLAGLGVDYGVHLLAARRFEAGEPTGPAADTAAVRVGPTLLAACVTSCFGFAAVAFAGVRALSEFAVLGVLGLVATLAMTVFFLPAALRLAGDDRGARPRLDPAPVLRRLLRHPRPPLFAVSVAGGMVAAVLFLGGEVRFADDLEAMHARPNPPLLAQERLSGDAAAAGLLVLVEADPLRPGSLGERARAAEAALGELARDPASSVASVLGPGRWLPVPPAAAGDPTPAPPAAAEALARFDAAAAAAGFAPGAFAGFRGTLGALLTPGPPPGAAALAPTPAGRLLPRVDPGRPDAEPDAALVLVRLERAWELLPDRAGTLGRVRSAVAGVPGATATGLSVVGADMQARVAAVLPRLLALAGLAVVVWLAVVFRSPWDVFLALGPAAAGLAAVLAAVVATGTELQAANLIALPLTLGLGVDDGIFLVHVARGVRRAGRSPAAGVTPPELEAAAAGPVHAVLVTSVTTIAAFGSLWFTRSPAIASLGLLSAVGVAACLLASLLGLLPALAIQQRRLRARRERP